MTITSKKDSEDIHGISREDKPYVHEVVQKIVQIGDKLKQMNSECSEI